MNSNRKSECNFLLKELTFFNILYNNDLIKGIEKFYVSFHAPNVLIKGVWENLTYFLLVADILIKGIGKF